MAKPARKPEQVAPITEQFDANAALQQLGQALDRIAAVEAAAREQIRIAQESMESFTAYDYKVVEELESALETWAKTARKDWPAKSTELQFGTVGFRLPPPSIKLLLEVETVIQRLRARKMETCIRVKEDVDKEALAAYDDEILEKLGCKRTKPRDKFYYELTPDPK